MANWFVTLAGAELGPLTDAQLRQLAREEKLGRNDVVRRDGITAPVAAGDIRGLFPPSAPPPPPPSPLPPARTGTFSAWYGEHVGKWEAPFQVLAWIFYGFLWIPVWWGMSLLKDPHPPLQAKGKRVLTFVAVGFIACLVLGIAGQFNRPTRTRSPSTRSTSAGITPEMSAQAAAIQQQFNSSPTAQLSIDQFREEILGRDFVPKESFYKKYGRPLRTFTIADDTYLMYRCSKGFVTVKCPAGPFQYQDDIAPVAVDEQ